MIVAAPVGHIVCAMALLNSNIGTTITDKNAFFLGTNFPDIRYISHVNRAATHKLKADSLVYVLQAQTSFEAGRRFHVLIDREREKHMLLNKAYSFIKNGPLKTQILKIVEDHIMFDKLKGNFDAHQVFKKIHNEERNFTIKDTTIETWHRLLATYLDQSSWFAAVRYYKTLNEFQRTYELPKKFFSSLWQNIRIIGFFIYAYFQVEKLSRDKELRKIILDFYENKINNIINKYSKEEERKAVDLHTTDPPFNISLGCDPIFAVISLKARFADFF